jgi:hypothetical protein
MAANFEIGEQPNRGARVSRKTLSRRKRPASFFVSIVTMIVLISR